MSEPATATLERGALPDLKQTALLKGFAAFLTLENPTLKLFNKRDGESGEEVLDEQALRDWYLSNRGSEKNQPKGFLGKFWGGFRRKVQAPEHGGFNDQINRFVALQDQQAGGITVTRENLVAGITTEHRQALLAALEGLGNDEQQSEPFLTEPDRAFLEENSK